MTPQSLAAEVQSLFALPQVVLRVHALLDSPEVNAHEISAVVELDAGLAAGVLRLANSPIYAQHGQVASVYRAIDLIGRRALRGMMLATSVVKVFAAIPEEFVDMPTFWDNSVTCGVAAQLLAQHVRARDADSLFLAGLLHGVGRLVFYARRPIEYRALLAENPEGEKALAEAEQRAFGFTYAELGAALLENWGLPAGIVAAIRYQITPAAAPAAHARDVAIVHVANDLAASLAPCLKSRLPPTHYSPGYDLGVGQILDIDPETLEDIRVEALSQTFAVIEIINPGSSLIF